MNLNDIRQLIKTFNEIIEKSKNIESISYMVFRRENGQYRSISEDEIGVIHKKSQDIIRTIENFMKVSGKNE